MKHRVFAVFLGSALFQAQASDARTDALCAPLLAFVNAVQPDETRRLAFHTSWGGNFKNDASPALMAKRCDHEGYEPAQAVCKYLVEHSSAEFADFNLKRALMCLSPDMKINSLSFKRATISTHYGTDDRGSFVDFELMEDTKIGGTVLTIVVSGY